jgi:pyrroline-5-carboxylate reductase
VTGALVVRTLSQPLRAHKEITMQVGMIGLGRMGANMVRRLIRKGSQQRGVQQVPTSRERTRQGKGDRRHVARRRREET